MKENILFVDDKELLEVANNAEKVESVGLVDFNEITSQFKSLQDKIHFIMDHHVDNGLY